MAATRTTDGVPPPRDWQILLIVGLLSLIVLAALWAVSNDAPSARQLDSVALITEGVTGEEGCTNFARFWMRESGLNVPAEAIAGLTNCRMSEDGSWFVPANPFDPRLTEPERLTSEEQERVVTLGAQLAADLAALDRTVPQSLRESLKANYETENLPVFGHTKRGRTDLGAKWDRYVEVTQAFLLSPDHALLADYVGWLMERRLTAVESFEAACFASDDNQFLWRACKGLRNEFGIGNIPLYWVLNDPLLIREYLVDRAMSGAPLPPATPTSTR